ncbi:MotA/TolQ/ExbB proton channel family protein [Mitsuaria sp. TWR114]|jgi:biopolymer transport protein ExbB|uniref:MotA/TolQ/ExbB proton channel family protein n=1 Tax=unclassified Roseateles TaxID=2626991 RepID=UPI0008F2996E|nr:MULTISPECIES: MotA/TolQ/ExbB proton channel family protein [unclassified Roseateles]MBB3282239.1 biopolymer transport protein ExbB [Mitsuaria sp. BK037]MBB3294295.1 biopolymer transport protein ExbB [Mitsuaria sp. BK041]MBB3363511.1 biopolymer transport protein ExbB [Mitsuaria sp. BK045]TXD99304.1 MotA/TolQ/ExbB proton channel family protein [Mitsuaria sp. TWR114]SFR97450.1 outer membrane transport energization protein ExbB [Mitsuaria sp. PDC51]
MISRLSALFAAVACAATLAVSPLAAQAQDQAASAAASAAEATPAPADIAPAAVAEPAAAKPVDNPYSLGNIVAHGNVVDQAVLAILAIMSMGSWYILFTKLWDTSKIAREAKEVRASFFKKASLQEGLKSLSETGAFRFIAQTGVEASEHHEGALTENIDHNTWVTMNIDRAVQEVNSRLQGGLGFLATVGSTSPFIGLFGTVWGILQALTQIGVAGQASIDKVAGPVGAALIMTAIGLGVAVPAVLGYNWLVNRNKSVMGQVRAFAADLHGVLMGSRKVAGR